MDRQRVVLCMKWGPLYPAAYVNVLYSAVRRNLDGPFRFVVLTDEPEGLAEGIEHFPIPEIGLDEWHWYDGVWPKLGIFRRDLYGLTGRCLFIDLDMMICDWLEPFFDFPAPFVTIDTGPNWAPNHGNGPVEPGTGIIAFDLGQESQILDRFMADRDGCVARFTIEQNCVAAYASSMACWPAGWVISFKRHLRRPPLLGLVLPVHAPAPPAKILAFHGEPRPLDLLRKGFWGRFPHLGRGPVRWFADYWAANNGPIN